MMKRLSVLALAALAACGTPQEQCISRSTRDLRTVDRLIVETEGNLKRGYALETVTRYEDFWDTCFEPVMVNGQTSVQAFSCRREYSYTEQRPKAIDLKAEAQKLDSLKAKRSDLAKAAAPLIAQCKVDYPE
jgi:hypothetical protein